MCRALIFDMDGLLVDSEPVHAKNTIRALGMQGIRISEKEFFGFWTKRGKNIHDFKRERGLDIDVDLYKKTKIKTLPEFIENSDMMEGAAEILDRFVEKYPFALVSNSSRSEIDVILDHYRLRRYFRHIIGLEDVIKPKPDPQGYLLSAQRLGLDAKDCLAFDDTWAGTMAAKRAGMRVVAIPNKNTEDHDFTHADMVIDSLKRVDQKMLDSLYGR